MNAFTTRNESQTPSEGPGWLLSAEEELARAIHALAERILIDRHPDPEGAGEHLCAWLDLPKASRAGLIETARLAFLLRNPAEMEKELAQHKAEQEARGGIWELGQTELKAYEPQPDPSLARIADILQELLELQPGKQSKTRRELEQLRQMNERQQEALNKAWSLSHSLAEGSPPSQDQIRVVRDLLNDFAEVPHMLAHPIPPSNLLTVAAPEADAPPAKPLGSLLEEGPHAWA